MDRPSSVSPLIRAVVPSTTVVAAVTPIRVRCFSSYETVTLRGKGLLRSLSESGTFTILSEHDRFCSLLMSLARTHVIDITLLNRGRSRRTTGSTSFVTEIVGRTANRFGLVGSYKLSPFATSMEHINTRGVCGILLTVTTTTSTKIKRSAVVGILASKLPSVGVH